MSKVKLEVGMYVRLKRNQGIAKIEDYEEYVNRFVLDEVIGDEWGEETCLLDLDDVLKASHNIIDLIEVGDYVNGKLVTEINKVFDINNCKYIECYCEMNGTSLCWCYFNNKIKSIVTKEQIEVMKYEIK